MVRGKVVGQPLKDAIERRDALEWLLRLQVVAGRVWVGGKEDLHGGQAQRDERQGGRRRARSKGREGRALAVVVFRVVFRAVALTLALFVSPVDERVMQRHISISILDCERRRMRGHHGLQQLLDGQLLLEGHGEQLAEQMERRLLRLGVDEARVRAAEPLELQQRRQQVLALRGAQCRRLRLQQAAIHGVVLRGCCCCRRRRGSSSRRSIFSRTTVAVAAVVIRVVAVAQLRRRRLGRGQRLRQSTAHTNVSSK